MRKNLLNSPTVLSLVMALGTCAITGCGPIERDRVDATDFSTEEFCEYRQNMKFDCGFVDPDFPAQLNNSATNIICSVVDMKIENAGCVDEYQSMMKRYVDETNGLNCDELEELRLSQELITLNDDFLTCMPDEET